MALLAGAGLALYPGCGRTPLRTGQHLAESESEPGPPPDTQRLVFDKVDKVDLLFVIDNSPSMADKQELLKDAVPTLLERLINPPCISRDDRGVVVEVDGPGDTCPQGFVKEFEPLIDLHVGVITSSLGGHGGDICSPFAPTSYNESRNDRAHLLATVRPDLPAYDNGFLAWDPAGTKHPPGDDDVDTFMSSFQDHVVAAGEDGCGYEATQEAWYRFLVEPDPYQEVVVEDNQFAVAQGTDEVLLAQRAAFVRPDSLLMLVILSDEDDCSVVDGGIGWIVSQATAPFGGFTFPVGTTACATNPNDVCCRSCGLAENHPPRGCPPLDEDPACLAPRAAATDSINLRCFRQKERFGLDLLYPVSRYSDALTKPTVTDTRYCTDGGLLPSGEEQACPIVGNPLFQGTRDPSLVIYTAIVGVPWQDIATADSLQGDSLEYLNAAELSELDRWALIVGDPERGIPPLDPLMIASTEPRTGVHPLTGEPLGPAESVDPKANSINGHEYANSDNSDLQYACTFPLATPRDCDQDIACDCSSADLARNRPLCNPPEGGPAETTQHYAKAYPGARHLQVARRLGEMASVASICPKVVDPPTSAVAYGYNPAAEHMYARLAGGLGERCLSKPLPHSEDGRAECVVWQLLQGDCDCEARGLLPIDERARASVDQTLAFECSYRLRQGCENSCACQVPQLEGRALARCQTDALATGLDGWCSVDPSQGIGDAQFVADCRAGHPRTLRMLGRFEALEDEELFLTCPE